MKPCLAILFLPLAVYGQLTLTTGDCATGTPIGSNSSFDFGQVAAGTTKTVTFLGCNPGNTVVNVTTILVAGAGFVLTGAPTTYPDAPLNTNPLRFSVQFSAVTPASYSASLQVNSINVFLLATVVPAITLSVSPPCTLTGNQISFGSVSFGKSEACTFSLQPTANVAVTGSGFQPTSAPGSQTFTIQLAPVCGTTFYSGTLSVGIQTYALSGTGFLPPLPAPILTFDATTFGSNQQHTLTMSLPSVYPCPTVVSGNLKMSFEPANGLPDDSSIFFIPGSTPEMSFTLGLGGTQFLFGTQSSVAFNTGSTAGAITFSIMSASVEVPDTVFPILPATISIDTATASNQILGQLDVSISGYDNTYTAGMMSFTFFDSNGNAIGTPISADFTSNFTNYFSSYSLNCTTGQPCGSTFQALLSFLVSGNQAEVASVAVTLTNAAGQAQTGKLTFQ